MFTTRCYTNPRLPYLTLTTFKHKHLFDVAYSYYVNGEMQYPFTYCYCYRYLFTWHISRSRYLPIRRRPQLKSMMLTDAGCDEPLRPYRSWKTSTTFQQLSVQHSGLSPVPVRVRLSDSECCGQYRAHCCGHYRTYCRVSEAAVDLKTIKPFTCHHFEQIDDNVSAATQTHGYNT